MPKTAIQIELKNLQTSSSLRLYGSNPRHSVRLVYFDYSFYRTIKKILLKCDGEKTVITPDDYFNIKLVSYDYLNAISE